MRDSLKINVFPTKNDDFQSLPAATKHNIVFFSVHFFGSGRDRKSSQNEVIFGENATCNGNGTENQQRIAKTRLREARWAQKVNFWRFLGVGWEPKIGRKW